MRATKKGRFTVRRVEFREHGVSYFSYRLTGWVGSRRIRMQFKSRDEDIGEKHRREVEAANAGEIAARNTRLTSAQLAEAEAAFARLGARTLSAAVEWFLETYRPPVTEKPLEGAEAAFLEDRKLHVRPMSERQHVASASVGIDKEERFCLRPAGAR